MRKIVVLLTVFSAALLLQAKTLMLLDFESDADLKKIELTAEPIRVNPIEIGGIPGQDAVVNCDPIKDFDPSVLPYERVSENATFGKSALKVTDKPKAGNIHFIGFPKDWTGYPYLKLDIFNPSSELVSLMIVLTDASTRPDKRYTNSIGTYQTRADISKNLKPGMNSIVIELEGLANNEKLGQLDLSNIKKLAVDIQGKSYTLDNVRLDSEE